MSVTKCIYVRRQASVPRGQSFRRRGWKLFRGMMQCTRIASDKGSSIIERAVSAAGHGAECMGGDSFRHFASQ